MKPIYSRKKVDPRTLPGGKPDQAQSLRDLMAKKKKGEDYEGYLKGLSNDIKDILNEDITSDISCGNSKKPLQIIAITSGKGGVGKTTLSANLAMALAAAGNGVVLLDADLGMANLDLVMGLSPKKNLYHVISGVSTIDEIIEEGPLGIKVIAGGSGLSELADLSPISRNRLMSSLKSLNDMGDFLIIDTGAGISANVLNFLRAAHRIILLLTPEPTAIADAYGVLKALKDNEEKLDIIPIANRVGDSEEGRELLRRFRGAAERFLNLELHPGSSIVEDTSVRESIIARSPLMTFNPRSAAVNDIRALGDMIMQVDPSEEKSTTSDGISGFIKKLSRSLLKGKLSG